MASKVLVELFFEKINAKIEMKIMIREKSFAKLQRLQSVKDNLTLTLSKGEGIKKSSRL